MKHHRRSSRAIYAAIVAFFSFGAAGSCGKEEDKPRRSDPPAAARNVLLVIIDTLRADKLGCYGNTLGLTPNIDAFARESFVFQQAFSHAPWTLPSTASLLTSCYPQQHGAGAKMKNGGPFDFEGLSPDVRTIAECFYDQGYDTAAIVNVFFLSKKYKMDRGFETHDYFDPPNKAKPVERRATEISDWAIDWIRKHQEKSDRPFFLMVHYFDPHMTYDPPVEYRKKFALSMDHQPDPTLFGTAQDVIKFRNGVIPASSIPIPRLEALYHAEIAYTDHEVGRLLAAVKESKLDEQTITVLTADHGEEFMEHNGLEHGHTLYDELIHVPLMMHNPELIQAGRSALTVEHVDVAPTLCGLTGIQTEHTFQGASLEKMLYAKTGKNRPIFSQGNMWGPILTAFRKDGFKFIDKSVGRELYDIINDPAERRNLVKEAQFVAKCDKLEADVKFLKEIYGKGRGISVPLTDAEKKHLASLGYALGEAPSEDEDTAYDHDTATSARDNPSTQPADNGATSQPVEKAGDAHR